MPMIDLHYVRGSLEQRALGRGNTHRHRGLRITV